MATLRDYNGWQEVPITGRRRDILTTEISVEKEIWLELESIYRVRRSGLEFISRRRGIARTALIQTYERFCAFCRQAEIFYNSATNLPWNSSPLFYYYSFMNLAKANLMLNQNLLDKMQHGLSYDIGASTYSLKKQAVIFQNNFRTGIFPKLYELIIRVRPTVNSFPIYKLLSYISVMSYQFAKANIGKVNNIPCFARILSNYSRRTSWMILLVPSPLILEQGFSFSHNFSSRFEIVNIPP